MDIGIPEILLIVGGFVALLIVHMYRKDDESKGYKAATVLGFLVGVALLVVTGLVMTGHMDEKWEMFDAVLILIAGFALMIRPVRDTDIAIIFAVVAMIFVYIFMGTMSGDLSGLATGWPRIIATIVVGALVYMILNFIQKIAQLIGKLLNFWPVLGLLGIVCLVEGALILAGGKTLFDYIEEYRAAGSIIASLIY